MFGRRGGPDNIAAAIAGNDLGGIGHDGVLLFEWCDCTESRLRPSENLFATFNFLLVWFFWRFCPIFAMYLFSGDFMDFSQLFNQVLGWPAKGSKGLRTARLNFLAAAR